ncbi:MAG: serine hydrolase, partial [Candidatus Methanoperedens sp.]|nr:serine hydrolase [Candidatus Methanoperedens sp.]
MFTLFLFAGVANAQFDAPIPDYWPTEDWHSGSPADHGFDEAKLAEIEGYVQREAPYLDSLLIIRNGYIVYESYFNGYDADTLHDVASVTKSWTSALVGIAQAQGKLTDLDATLPTLLPDHFAEGAYADKSEITLRHLLMMRSGIAFDDNAFVTGEYGSPEDLLKSDTTAVSLGFPIAYPPGQTWNYSSLDTQLLSAIVQRAVGHPLHEYIVPNLFEPMGIGDFEWLVDESGTTVGGGSLSITPRDMAKLGLLYLHNGIWGDEQLVPAEWVASSLTPQGKAFYPPTDQDEIIEWYGYKWWLWKEDWHFGYRSIQAQGYAGQQVLVFPELSLIFVTTANQDGVDPETAQRQEQVNGRIVLDFLFPALTDVEL